MRIVVCDTGPVLHLREAGVLDILQHAGEVLIPAAVDDELTRLIDDWTATRPAWLVRRALDPAAAPAPIQRESQHRARSRRPHRARRRRGDPQRRGDLQDHSLP